MLASLLPPESSALLSCASKSLPRRVVALRAAGHAPGRSGTASGGHTHATAAHNSDSTQERALAVNEGPSAVPAGSAGASNALRSRSLPVLTPSRALPSQVNHVQTHTRLRISRGRGALRAVLKVD